MFRITQNTNFIFSNIFEAHKCDTKMCKVLISRQESDCNILRSVIPYSIIKSTYSHCEDVLFNPFFLKDNYSQMALCVAL